MNELNETMFVLGDLVGFPTVTSDTNLPLIDYVADRLDGVADDLRITRDESGAKANLFATMGPQIDGGVILSGHTDVVPAEDEGWTGSPFVAMRRRQRIYGRGTADMKGFIACALVLAPYLSDQPLQRPIHLALTFDEEVGCHGAPLLIADLVASGLRPSAAVIGEPTGMDIVVAHKGIHEYTTTITGVEGHGSKPARAVNAVQFGSRYVTKLMSLADELATRAPEDSPYDPPHTTISAGSMHGGTAHNIVAGECVIQWEMRPVRSSDARFVLDEIRVFESDLTAEMNLVSPEAGIARITEGSVGGLEDEGDSVAVRLAAGLLEDSRRHAVPFSTEAGLFQEAGIPSVVCGPGSIDVAHQPDEYVGLEDLARCLEFMKGVAARLS